MKIDPGNAEPQLGAKTSHAKLGLGAPSLPPGYKQTEVGVIPEEWEVVTASEACELVVDCKNRTPPVVADSDYAVVRTPNVRDGKFVLEELRFTDAVSYREWTARAVPQSGDIMITREAPLGEVCEVPPNRKACLGQRMMLYRPAPAKTASNYLLFALMSEPVRANLLRKIGGSTVGHAKVDDIRFLQLPHPPLPEQRAIAAALSDVDGLLGALDRLIAKKRDLKQAAMQQLLTGQTRLPGFKGEWVMKTLGEIAKIQRGASPRPIDSPVWFDDNSSIGWVRISDVTRSGMFLLETTQRLSPLGVQYSRPVATGTLIMSICATVGRPIITKIDVCIHDGFVVFENLQAEQLFIYYFLKWIEPDWSKHGQTGSQMNLNTALITGTTISQPPLPEQTAIASVLSEMDLELAALEQRREKTRALKQGMMQELLTGRTRLI